AAGAPERAPRARVGRRRRKPDPLPAVSEDRGIGRAVAVVISRDCTTSDAQHGRAQIVIVRARFQKPPGGRGRAIVSGIGLAIAVEIAGLGPVPAALKRNAVALTAPRSGERSGHGPDGPRREADDELAGLSGSEGAFLAVLRRDKGPDVTDLRP